MKNLEVLSSECLRAKVQSLNEDIKSYETALKACRSQLISLFYRSMIKSWKSQIHAIEAELHFRGEEI